MSIAKILKSIEQNPLARLYKYFIIDSLLIVRKQGLKELVRQRGKKFLFAIFGYYLVRDTLVYIVIPVCVARGIF